MKKFNINEYMYIQITEDGWKYLRETVGESYIEACVESRKKEIDSEIWYKLLCHNVFELFPMRLGSRPYFNTNVMFDEKALT